MSLRLMFWQITLIMSYFRSHISKYGHSEQLVLLSLALLFQFYNLQLIFVSYSIFNFFWGAVPNKELRETILYWLDNKQQTKIDRKSAKPDVE